MLTKKEKTVISEICLNYEMTLGGSHALALYGAELGRPLKDIDLTYHRKNCPQELVPFMVKDNPFGSGSDVLFVISVLGVEMEILYSPTKNRKPFVIQGIPVQEFDDIWNVKCSYARKGESKHARDLLVISKQLRRVRKKENATVDNILKSRNPLKP